MRPAILPPTPGFIVVNRLIATRMNSENQFQQWFLLKKNESEPFGPSTLDQLRAWAASAKISPMDMVSSDQESWFRAPMLPELEMDWLIKISADQYYGPTTLGAVNEFLEAGQINIDTMLINCKSGQQHYIADMDLEIVDLSEEDSGAPAAETSIGLSPEEKIRALEETLEEERRTLRTLEQQFHQLSVLYKQETGKDPRI